MNWLLACVRCGRDYTDRTRSNRDQRAQKVTYATYSPGLQAVRLGPFGVVGLTAQGQQTGVPLARNARGHSQ
jgi:hypothetical protein